MDEDVGLVHAMDARGATERRRSTLVLPPRRAADRDQLALLLTDMSPATAKSHLKSFEARAARLREAVPCEVDERWVAQVIGLHRAAALRPVRWPERLGRSLRKMASRFR